MEEILGSKATGKPTLRFNLQRPSGAMYVLVPSPMFAAR